MIVFVPIKHNSQRVPRKNFRIFDGVPLFKRTLLKYKKHDVFVDTDSEELKSLIKTDDDLKNVNIIERKEHLKGDKVSVCDLIKSFIIDFSINCPIVQTHVTSPFLSEKTVKLASDYLTEYDSVVSCNQLNSRLWRKEKYGYCPVNHNPVKMEQTQDLPPYYEENSAFYIFKPEVIINLNSRIGTNPFFYPIDKIESVDIDNEDDWRFAINLKK